MFIYNRGTLPKDENCTFWIISNVISGVYSISTADVICGSLSELAQQSFNVAQIFLHSQTNCMPVYHVSVV